LLLTGAFILLPAGVSIVIASKTVRQGGNINFSEVRRNAAIILCLGAIIIIIPLFAHYLLGSRYSEFEIMFGAGEVLVMLGVVELLRYFVFGKPRGTQILAKTGWLTSLIGVLLVFASVIAYFCGCFK